MEIEESLPLRTRDGLNGGRTKTLCLNYGAKEGQVIIQCVVVISLYSSVFK